MKVKVAIVVRITEAIVQIGVEKKPAARARASLASSIIHVELTLEISGTPVIRIPAPIMMVPAVVIAAPPPIMLLMPPSLDHALIGHCLIGDATRGHRACR